MINRNFAQLTSAQPIYINLPIKTSAGDLWTNDPAVMLAHGYKQVIRTDMPITDGYYYTPVWSQDDTTITQSWEAHEIPVEPDPFEIIDIMEGVTE